MKCDIENLRDRAVRVEFSSDSWLNTFDSCKNVLDDDLEGTRTYAVNGPANVQTVAFSVPEGDDVPVLVSIQFYGEGEGFNGDASGSTCIMPYEAVAEEVVANTVGCINDSETP